MTALDLGTDTAHTSGPQTVPLEARSHTTVIVGNTGSGKSATARGSYVEPILEARRRTVIIDPTGIWWGLRFMADGSPGYAIGIVGGQYGDAPLQACDAVRLADWVGTSDLPLIVDVSEMTIGERHEFAEGFFAQLHKANRRPLHLIIDEADEFAPQNPLPETRRMLHQVDRIVRRGRVRGFRPMMITQRPSVLHKNVMSQASSLAAMRLLGSQDRDAVQAWIKGQGDVAAGKEVLGTLARLHVGEGWLWIPALGVLNRGKFPMFRTFDSSRTPQDDEPPVEPPGPFPYREKFAVLAELLAPATVEPIEAPKGTAASDADVTAAERRGYRRGREDGIEAGYQAGTAAVQGIVSGVIKRGNEFIDTLKEAASALSGKPQPTIAIHTSGELSPGTKKAIIEMAKAASKTVRGQLGEPLEVDLPQRSPMSRIETALAVTGGAERLLAALACFTEPATWQGVCVIAGFQHGNGYFYRGRKYLVHEGLCEEHGQLVQITKPGLVMTKGPRTMPTLAELLATWSAKLDGPGGRMVQVIASVRGQQMTIAQLAAATRLQPGNGFWYRGLKSARNSGLLQREGDTYRLTPIIRDRK